MDDTSLPEVLLTVGMNIQFDEEKDDKNKSHGYSLSCASDILEDIMLGFKFFIWDEANGNYEEHRFKLMTKYQDDIVFLVFTHRQNDNGDWELRPISLRSASDKESVIFESMYDS